MRLNQCGLRASSVSQATVDRLVVDFVTEALLPFSVVGLPSFKRLVTGLQPSRTVLCRKTVKARMADMVSALKTRLVETLRSVDCVATTTDCWSARNRSYLGVTAHWIDSVTLGRVSAALACRRLRGSHTFLALASALESVHRDYGISRSVVMTTTDNGSNFVKAFSVFGRVQQDGSGDEEESDDESGVNGAVGTVYHEVDHEFDTDDTAEFDLPRHHRCACHTLQLVATVDADSAEDDAVYKRISRATFAKCQALWNKSARSVLSAEAVMETCGMMLLRPNQTRWNSLFMAAERLVRISTEKGDDALNSLCAQLSVPR